MFKEVGMVFGQASTFADFADLYAKKTRRHTHARKPTPGSMFKEMGMVFGHSSTLGDFAVCFIATETN